MQLRGRRLILQRHSKNDWISWLPVLFWLANLYRMTGHGNTIYLAIFSGVGAFGLLKFAFDRKLLNSVLLPAMLLYFIPEVLNWLIIQNLNYRDIINDLLLFGILVIMFAYPQTYKNGVVCYYASAVVFISAYFRERDAYTILLSSGNYVSVVLILISAYYYFCLDNSAREFKLIDILPALLSYLLSIWAEGRGGILSCTLLLILILILYARSYARKSTRRYITVFVAVMIVISILLLWDISLIDLFMSMGKWRNKGIDNSARRIIWISYLNEATSSVLYFILGAPLSKIPVVQAVANNTHNSFIQLHAYNGLVTFAVFVVAAIKSLVYEIKHGQYLTAIAMIAVIVRGMTDKFIFGQYGMPIMLYLILWPYMESYVKTVKGEIPANTSAQSKKQHGGDRHI